MITNNGKSIQFWREFNVPVETLFKAWANPVVFKTWWKEITVAEMDFRVGGQYSLKWSDPKDYARGVYQEIIPNQKIVMTWNTSQSCGGKEASLVSDSLITMRFSSRGPQLSMLEFVHDLLPMDRIDDHHLGWTCAMLDLDRHFNSAARTINPELKVRLERELPFPVSKVYDAWTKPELILKWFNRTGATAGKAGVNLEVGKNLFMDYQKTNGNIIRLYCEFLEIIPLQKLVFKWADDNHEDDHITLHKQVESRVTVLFTDLGARTRLELIHDQITSAIEMEDYQHGWTGCLKSMVEELEQATPV